jgi:PAS domain S-box-containing protein
MSLWPAPGLVTTGESCLGSRLSALGRGISSRPPLRRSWLRCAGSLRLAFRVLVALRSRTARRESQRIFDLSLDLLCVTGLDGYLKRVNPAFERALGYSREQLLSRPFTDFIHPADRRRTREAIATLACGHEVVEFENRYIRADGSVRWLQWNARPVPQEGLVYSAARDVTDRRHAEGELRAAQRMVEAGREALRVLADEQAALRRVATLVARGVSASEIFSAVAKEVGRVLVADDAAVLRFEPDGVGILAGMATVRPELPLGSRWEVDDAYAATAVWRTGRAARKEGDAYRSAVAAALASMPPWSTVASPIVVEGSLWGAMIVTLNSAPLPPDTEERMAKFTELVATAIANAQSRAELAASRARLVAAADESRRRIERDLHDGTQQRLVALGLVLRATEADVPPELPMLRASIAATATGLAAAVDELREISRGIHPVVLTTGGIRPALNTLARRSPVPVELAVHVDRRLPERVEVATYYVVSEALANAAKHAHASVVQVDVDPRDAGVELVVRDDGVGGADTRRGSGLIGLRDRVEALGGTLEISSSAGKGTSLLARIPIERGEMPRR